MHAVKDKGGENRRHYGSGAWGHRRMHYRRGDEINRGITAFWHGVLASASHVIYGKVDLEIFTLELYAPYIIRPVHYTPRTLRRTPVSICIITIKTVRLSPTYKGRSRTRICSTRCGRWRSPLGTWGCSPAKGKPPLCTPSSNQPSTSAPDVGNGANPVLLLCTSNITFRRMHFGR